MDNKEKLEQKLQELKNESEKDNQILTKLEQQKNILIQQMLIRSGRILELEDLLK